MRKKLALILSILITLLIASNISLFYITNQSKTILVTEVIDGDTFKSEDKTFRLVNINTPEKGENGYEEAKDFLSEFNGKQIGIEELSTDKYGRTLVRAYSSDYINLELVKKGLAKKFLVQEEELKTFDSAEKTAVRQEKGLWKKSDSFGCFEVEIYEVEEIIKIVDNCKTEFGDFIVADESRKRYKFPDITFTEINLHSSTGEDNETDIFWNSNSNIWNNDRDTIYFYDSQNLLAYHRSYGY